MLMMHGYYLAIEPVTTTVVLVALGKALVLFGAADGGSIAGQYAAGNKGKKTVSRGVGIAASNFSLISKVDDAASRGDTQKT
jgi:hypothetical protein